MSDGIESILVDEGTPHYTQRRPVLIGSFNLSRASIPYFQTVMSLEEVAKELELVETLPSDLRARWRLEELFQREIDWERVENEIVKGYLERPEKLQFFNSLTVALLPTDSNRMLARNYGDAGAVPPVPENLKAKPWETVNVGGVQLTRNDRSPHGYVSWDPMRIFPATIDGQHRLAALQMHYRRGHLTVRQLKTGVSVMFLVLDPRAGFELETQLTGDGENPILTIVREIFIDLNKTARSVNRSRRILLDDQEIESRCVRALLSPRVGEAAEGRLPLGLVHWQHNVTAKFNSGEQTGPFVTTVELLYSIVGDLLDLDRPKDPLDETEVRRFVQSIEDAVGVSELIANHPARYPSLPPLISYVEQLYLKEGFEQPFANLPAQYLRACDQGFEERFRRPIVSVLTNHKPYREFIEQVRQRGGIEGDLAFYLCLPMKAQRQQVEEWGEARIEKLDKPLKELAKMKTHGWPFYAVFQKAIFHATKNALTHSQLIPGLRDANQEAVVGAWIEFLDECWDRDLFLVKAPLDEKGMLWSGVSLNPGARTVKWSNVSVQRISDLLLLWWYLYANRLSKVGSFVRRAEAPRGEESFPEAKRAIARVRLGLKSAVSYGEEEIDGDEIDKRVQKRLVEILKLGRHRAEIGEIGSDDEDDGDSGTAQEGPGSPS